MALVAAAITTPSVAQQVDIENGFTPITKDSQGTIWLIKNSDYLGIWEDTIGARLWTRQDHSMDPTIEAIMSLSYYEVNCPTRSYKMLQTHSYDRSGNITKPVYKQIYGETVAPPGSLIGVTIDYVCTPRS